MKIQKMTLKNFRLFRYAEEIDFGDKKDKPLTIVRAENRTGKTTLLTALQWCFYGNVVLDNAKQLLTDGDLLVSQDALNDAKAGDTINTQVEIQFTHEGTEFIAKRVRETKRATVETESCSTGQDLFTILRKDATGIKSVPNPGTLIQLILPDDLRELFFFDGDRINRFMEPDHQEAVQKAVSDMLEFELFDEAIRHLKVILADYRSQLRNTASGEALKLRNEQLELSNALDSIKEEAKGLRKEVDSAEILQEQISREIASDPGDAGKIQRQIRDLQSQIQNLSKAQQKLGEDLGRQLGTGMYFTIPDTVLTARSILAKKKEAGEIPKRIGEDLIKERLELGICICDRPLKPGDPARKHLEDELSKQKDRGVFDEMATDLLYYLNAFVRRDTLEMFNTLNDLLLQRETVRQTIIEIDKQKKELEDQLGNIDVEAIERKRGALKDINGRIKTIAMSISENQQKEQSIIQKQDDIGKRIKLAEKQDRQNRSLRVREKLTDDCIKALTLTYHNVREAERQKISDCTQDNFFHMNIRENEFEKVEVTPSFRLQVIAPGGYVANHVLSGAQRRALSLSFLFALMKVSERNSTVIIDTPLGMTSGPMRRSITEAMISQTKQLVLLLTRSEIQGVEDILAAGASSQYTLTCSHDYPIELVNKPTLKGSYTMVCSCGIGQQCPICERKPYADLLNK